MEDYILRTSLGLYGECRISFSPSSGPLSTPFTTVVWGVCYESRAFDVYDGMKAQLDIGMTLASIPFPQSMRVGARWDIYAKLFAVSLWSEFHPFTNPLASMPFGINIGIPFSWSTGT
jgi:hypothetical protein